MSALSKLIVAVTAFFALLVSSFTNDSHAKERPNVILVMADDLGWGDLRCFNPNSPIVTPHLDAMAAAGLKFTRFYAAAPVCSPTRGSCLTGRHPSRYGIHHANVGHLLDEEHCLAELLRQQGYATGHFGKWHLGTLTVDVQDSNRGRRGNRADFSPPQKHGFQTCFSTEAKVPTWDPMWRPLEAKRKGWNAISDLGTAVRFGTRYWDGQGQAVESNLNGDDARVIVDRAVEFVKRAASNEQPFFAVVWFHTPHWPVVAGPKYASMYNDQERLPRNYFGAVTAMDEQVGRLRRTLRDLGEAENTMLWFCSDNGPEGSASTDPGSAGYLRGRKRSLLEGGIRVPGILEWPAHAKAGATTGFPAVTSDYLPTVLHAIQAPPSAHRPLDGASLLPTIDDPSARREQGIGFQFQKQSAWITQRFKLYRPTARQAWQLYDLLEDPQEATDLASSKPQVVAQLSSEFEQWRHSCERSSQGADYR